MPNRVSNHVYGHPQLSRSIVIECFGNLNLFEGTCFMPFETASSHSIPAGNHPPNRAHGQQYSRRVLDLSVIDLGVLSFYNHH
jgi:hypothetical protein